MTPVLVDSSVILDIFTEDPKWFAWSSGALAEAAEVGRLVINPVVYGEVSVHFSSIEELNALLASPEYSREPIPFDAAFLAGKAFLDYRRRGGPRPSSLPDFFIGAHASVAGYRLLTRDPNRIRTYFPTVGLITP
jgi:predicted nucleic acid-binding protein